MSKAVTYPPDRVKSLAAALKRRRVELGFLRINAFHEAGGQRRLSYALIRAVEAGRFTRWGNWMTLFRLEVMYQLEEGAITAYLEGTDRSLRRASQPRLDAEAVLAHMGMKEEDIETAISTLRGLQAELRGRAS